MRLKVEIEDFSPNQNFENIRKKHSNTNRFVDTEFPACDDSIYHTDEYQNYLLNFYPSVSTTGGKFVWIRAKDYVQNAQFATDDSLEKKPFSPSTINVTNYRQYFRTTDLDQGCIGRQQ